MGSIAADRVASSSTAEISGKTATSELYKSILASNTNTNWKTDADPEEVWNLISASFSGSKRTDPEPSIEWALGGIVPSEYNQDRHDLYKYVLNMVAEETLGQDHFVFGHDASSLLSMTGATSSEENSGTLTSCIVLVEFDPQVELNKSALATLKENIRDILRLLKDAAQGNLPCPLQNISNLTTLASRVAPLKEQVFKAHKVYGPQEAHMYVKIVATDPSFQGQGLGKQLMTQLEDLADATGKSCYLECAGERNPIFYEKFGFRTVHELKLCEDGEDSDEVLYLMVREPQVQGVDERE